MIALFHDLSGKQVVIVGGGDVALRKARRFTGEAQVTVISPAFREDFADLPCELSRERLTVKAAGVRFDGAFLVVPATDDRTLNARLAALAREQGCLVNRVDRPKDGPNGDARGVAAANGPYEHAEDREERSVNEPGDETTGDRVETSDVIVPSSIEADPIMVAISTGGSSPAMAKYLRSRLEPIVEEAAPMVRLQRDLRAELKRTVAESADRRDRLWAVIESKEVWEALDAGEDKRARRVARERTGLPPEQ